jgi:hypothetical protein
MPWLSQYNQIVPIWFTVLVSPDTRIHVFRPDFSDLTEPWWEQFLTEFLQEQIPVMELKGFLQLLRSMQLPQLVGSGFLRYYKKKKTTDHFTSNAI